MFEKEAKKWVKENTRIEHSASFGEIAVEPSARKGFIAGAGFGYNKGRSEAKEIIQRLIANAPNTYSGTNIELQQKKMFSFQDAVNKAEQFLKETE